MSLMLHMSRKRKKDGDIRKETADSASVGASRANVAVIGRGKRGASAAGAEGQDLAGVLPVGAGADVNLE